MRPLPDLPVLEIADAVNRALADAPCVVVTAPPGAGKSTLLPLTILNGGISPEPPASLNHQATPVKGKILMLEPRRIAARQIAERMAALLGEPVAVQGPLIVVEGAYALLPEWGKYYDLALFLQVSQEEQQGRLLLRNGARGMVPFLTRWIPREESYFAACGVRARCDAVVDGE